MARMIYDRLRLEKHYRCFLDVETLNAGDFRKNIAAELKKCDIFLLILTSDALDRCDSPNDPVREEITAALDAGLAIIPVTAEDFTWPEVMPEGLEHVQDFNAIPYVQVYSDKFFELLYSFIDHVRDQDNSKTEIENSHQSSVSKPASETKKQMPEKTVGNNKNPKIIAIAAIAVVLIICLSIAISGILRKGTEGSSPETSLNENELLSIEEELPPTEGVIEEATEITGEDDFFTSTNMETAPFILEGQKYHGLYENGYAWAAFKTGEGENAEYTFTVQNMSEDSGVLIATLFDEFGNAMPPDSSTADLSGDHIAEAGPDGTPSSSTFSSLSPDTAYYIRLEGTARSKYALSVTKTE